MKPNIQTFASVHYSLLLPYFESSPFVQGCVREFFEYQFRRGDGDVAFVIIDEDLREKVVDNLDGGKTANTLLDLLDKVQKAAPSGTTPCIAL